MKRVLFLFVMVVVTSLLISQETSGIDPNHSEDGGYGYMIHSDRICSVWWAEGAYKVMRDAPIPTKMDNLVKMWSAKNEYESFILVLNPFKRMENFRITIPELKDNRGNTIAHGNITVRKVEYVRVTKPTDSYGFAGWWPDPVPLYKQPETIFPAENQPFWITVKVSSTAKAGDYFGNIQLSSDDWSLSVPVKLHVWDFTLPQKPSIRSGFGFSLDAVKEYDNIKTVEEEREVFDYYMKAFRDYKISPYDPFALASIKENITGVAWKGGFFDNKVAYEGKYSYRIEDHSATSNAEGTTVDFVPVGSGKSYKLSWVSRSLDDDRNYLVGVECYDAEKRLIPFQNRFSLYKGEKEWKYEEQDLGTFNNEVKFLKIRLFPTHRTAAGEHTGTVWFDDVKLTDRNSGRNEFVAGNFEVNLNDIDIMLDFTDFNKAGKRYFDDYGFTAYCLSLRGLGGGTFHSRREGLFAGFKQGTEEYNLLMKRYLTQIQNNLEETGWLGKEYIYWFDEPNEVDYPFVKETNALIKKYAPKLTTFLTEHVAGQDLSDVTDISCTIWHQLNHEKIKQMNQRGLQCWSYLCTAPKAPWITLFIDHDAINLRMWLWGSYKHKLKGILVWQTNHWNSPEASPQGYLQNPWEEAMSFVRDYDTPLGIQGHWGNGDGRFFYPVNRDPGNDINTYVDYPVPSLRLEILRDGIEDYEYFTILENLVNGAEGKEQKKVDEAKRLLAIPEDIYVDERNYSKNPRLLLEYRKKIAESILKLKK